jgi:hypothetical protein
MPKHNSKSPNPRRQAAGRQNHQKRRGFTRAGLDRLRAAALAFCPWKKSTGPRTVEGKAKSADNGRYRQEGEVSVRGVRAELAEGYELLREIREIRRSLEAYMASHGIR